jgi:hypothetical protein
MLYKNDVILFQIIYDILRFSEVFGTVFKVNEW